MPHAWWQGREKANSWALFKSYSHRAAGRDDAYPDVMRTDRQSGMIPEGPAHTIDGLTYPTGLRATRGN